jgi:hypothetical protein
MALWWIGDAVLIVVVVPLVALLLRRLLSPVLDIGRYVEDVHRDAGSVDVALDDVPALVITRGLVHRVGAGLVRYVNAVDRLL